MAYFGATLEQISQIETHPNADALDLGQLEGMSFQFVMRRDIFKVGDEVIYFPIDSVLPDQVAEACGVLGKLSGSQKNRLKTVRLRGEISQGLVVKPEDLEEVWQREFPDSDWRESIILSAMGEDTNGSEVETNDFTVKLNIHKYEPPIQHTPQRGARVSTLPTHLSKYDIEDATRYYESLSSYFDEGFVMTLKLEGSNFCVGYHPDEDPERRVYVCSRNQQLRRDPEIPREKQHFFLTCAENIGIEAKIAAWAEQNAPHEPVTLYGELLGPNVQKNFYNLSQHHVIFFDLKIGNRWVDYRDFRRICLEELKVNIAPELINLDDPLGESLSETLKSQSLIELSRVVGPQISPGPEPLSLVMRPKVKFHEGVVIKPRCEHYTPRGQRVILKKRCPDYLERSGL